MGAELTGSAVIVGAGQAGGWAARTLRSEGFTGRIVLIGDEAVPPYERPPLSKEQLQPVAPALPFLLTQEELKRQDIEWLAGARCARIDRRQRIVRLADDSVIDYDRLLLSTGGSARLPAIDGIDARCVQVLRTIEDATQLRAALRPGARVLVVGGGWIGLEVAAAARAVQCEVTLVEVGKQLCARTGSSHLSDYLAALHLERGVDVRLGTQIVALDEAGESGCRARFMDGASLDVDLVVVGIGLVPNDELARAADLVCDRGIVVDRQCRTSDASIFAAGDVTALRTDDGTLLRLESWQNAQDQGIAAARAMLGQDVDYRPVPYFWSQQYDRMVQIAGHCGPVAEIVVRQAAAGGVAIAELDADARLTSAICIGSPREFRQLRQFVGAGARIDRARFADAAVKLSDTAV
ncbi:NAD(P)/FAD-dependent oxidoreductase [Paraburkholderia sp. ZP32-5]|uniref:NAD(P)/FAD-dependent oxidoreductase n=1 Tax=Paraburkholderia sp. ZP32-5 TaxID=2883245 RepID=UPI001F204BA1|nr:FAD-dependent oxidoreductase [Paraburkholderia sp. ZP32-5]